MSRDARCRGPGEAERDEWRTGQPPTTDDSHGVIADMRADGGNYSLLLFLSGITVLCFGLG